MLLLIATWNSWELKVKNVLLMRDFALFDCLFIIISSNWYLRLVVNSFKSILIELMCVEMVEVNKLKNWLNKFLN